MEPGHVLGTRLAGLNHNSGARSVVATAVLVAITGWYAKTTRDMVIKMDEQRMDAVQPAISVDHLLAVKNAEGDVDVDFRMTTVGGGLALNIVVGTREVDKDWSRQRIPVPTLVPGASER